MSANKAENTKAAFWLRSPENARISFLVVLLATVIKLPLTTSLWLDEGITAWITRDSIVAAVNRATQYQGQSPLYFVFEWFWQLVFGSSEFALRMPSLIGVIGAALVLFLIARQIGGSAFGWLAAAVFLSIDSVQVAAVSARPYGLALFFSVAAVWALLRWESRGRYLYSLLYLFLFLMSVYLHYLFAAMFVVHAVHVALNFRDQRVKLSSYLSQCVLLGALLFPAFLHMVDMSGNQSAWQFVPRPTVVTVLRALLPPVLVICAAGAVVLGLLFGKGREYSVKVPVRIGGWIGFWYLFPPLLMLGLSLAGSSSLFLDRYFLFYAPGVALAFAAIPFVLRDPGTRAAVLCSFVALLLLRNIDREWRIENWRGAAELAAREGADVPVVIYSGLAESKEISWLRDEKKQEYLQAPLRYYGLSNVTAMLPPPDDRPETLEYFDTMARRLTEGSKRAVLVGLDVRYRGKSLMESWVERFANRGFVAVEVSLGKSSAVRAFMLTHE